MGRHEPVPLMHGRLGGGEPFEFERRGMKITRISAFAVGLRFREGTIRMSGGRSVSTHDSTLMRIQTDSGLTGWGEVCPFGGAYLPAYPAGARTGLSVLAPALIGADPREIDAVNRLMDGALKGHGYAKTALDIACWDLLGQAAGLPLCVLLGGRFGAAANAYHEVSLAAPADMAARVAAYRAQGYRVFQLKVGGNPDEDVARIRATSAAAGPGSILIADANGGWRMHDAAKVVRAVSACDVYIEQPCLTYDECLAIRRRTDLPFILDESIDSLDALIRAHRDGAMDAINIKLSKFGGLTRARRVRELCVELGIPVNIDETGGGDVTAAVLAHFAHSTPPRFRLAVAWSFLQVRPRIAAGAPILKDGGISAPMGSGLGIRVREDVLGDPILDFA